MTWYEDQDQYVIDSALPRAFIGDLNQDRFGPMGIALVAVYDGGLTSPGWGTRARDDKPVFMQNYLGKKFLPGPRVSAFRNRQKPFAIVMRSANVICLDIDQHEGAADGFAGVLTLGDLPPTLAETSKSGSGRHLFYRTHDRWDAKEKGFGAYDDAIGIAPGVDLRAVGCVYHYPTQRWNDLPLADIPYDLEVMLETRRVRRLSRDAALAAAAAGDLDDEETLIMHDALLQELAKPIPAGQRNNSLFAIGSKLKAAGVPDWDQHISKRADELGLDWNESGKIIRNIDAYA